MNGILQQIAGHVPSQMVQAISSFMEFCYLVRQSVIDEDDLVEIYSAVANFHSHREAFDLVHPEGYSLPCQHSITHYTKLIREFGAPNGLCSSIHKLKHIKAMKEPWQQSSHFEALGQMLITNQRLDKLAATCVNFQKCGIFDQPLFGEIDNKPPPLHEDDDGGGIDDDVMTDVILSQKPCEYLLYILPIF